MCKPISVRDNLISEFKKSHKVPNDFFLQEIIGHVSSGTIYDLSHYPEILFNLLFEWVKTDSPYKIRLHYRPYGIPEIIPFLHEDPSDEEDFYYYHNGKQYSSVFLPEDEDLDVDHIVFFSGKKFDKTTFADITFPIFKGIVRFLDYKHQKVDREKHLYEETDIIEIDYSPEALDKAIATYREGCEFREMLQEFKAIEEEKEKLKKKLQKDNIRKKAIIQLEEEGYLFPEASKRPPIPREVVDAVWRRDGGKCVYCGSTENLQLDHIIPFSKGGATTVENLQILCQKCNCSKSNRIG